MRLIWSGTEGLIDNGSTSWAITVAPALSFQFDGIFYYTDRDNYIKIIGLGRCALSQEEKDEIAAYIASAVPIAPPAPTRDQIIAQLEVSVQNYIDSVANKKGYDSAERCISYLNSTNDTWKSDATAMNSWRDQVWAYCQQQANSAATAPTADQLIAALPAAPW